MNLLIWVTVVLCGVKWAHTQNCGSNPADIVFLLDSSGSVGHTNFDKQKDFVAKFAQAFDIGPRNVQIGVTTFANTPQNQFNLNTYKDKTSMVNAIHHIPYHSGGTRTDLALKYIEANSFTRAAGDRPNVANILIVMTDGKSNRPSLTTAETAKLHQMNVKVFAIGIGSGVDKAELTRIATDSHHVFQVQNFDALNTLQAELKRTACKVDGGWTKYGSYSPCSKSCGGGSHFRERSCTNPRPANGGADCTGSAKQTSACNTQACPTPKPTTPKPVVTQPPTTVAPACQSTTPADIVFVLDASGSVSAPNFQTMLNFVQKMVDGFPVSKTQTQIGLVTFDSKTYLQFHLNKYSDKTSIKNAIAATKYTSGLTHTSDALKYVRQSSFTTQNGMRPGAAHIAIVVTDGQSNNPAATSSEAALLRKAGVTVFSIGVGQGAKKSELDAIATNPDATHVFQVTDFHSLSNIQGSLTTQTCQAATHPPATQPPTTAKPVCEAQADIMFLLDSSGSVGAPNFNKMLGFVKDISSGFHIGPQAVQVGVDTFETNPKAQFNMNTYHDTASVVNAISGIQYHPGLTHTGEALRFMKDNSFTAAAGDRANVPNIAIVVTDGQSNNPTLTAAEAKKARDAGITLLAIGVGSGVTRSELNAIASDPDSTHVFTADNFDALKSLKAMLSTKACEVSKPQQPPPSSPNCAAKADVVFILDSSGSIGQTNYNKMLDFVKDVASKFDIGADKVRIGTEIFSDRTFIQFHLNKYTDLPSLQTAISNIPYKRGTTNTGQALKDAYSRMFVQGNGDRPGIPNIAIVVTDGRSTNRPSTLAEAKQLRDHGVQVFTVGVGNGVDKSELNAIATDPDASHVLTVSDFNKLTQITASLNSKACAVIPTGTAPVMNTTPAPDPCRDSITNCASYSIPDVCMDFAGWAKSNCQKSCNFCQSNVQTTQPPCADVVSNCNEYDSSICTNQYKPWATDNCRQFCGFCNIGKTQITTGYFGKCFYKGNQYNQGQTWDDGCQYTCSCDDASTGKYSCYNKCPIYYNLPPQCTLVKTSGCCLQPVCDFKGTHLSTSGQGVGKYNGVNVCMYKNSPYYTGQTWQDGCDKTCYCQDGGVGLYTCQSVCGHYDHLPPQCRLETPAGKCCAEPVCTFSKQYGQFNGVGTVSGKGTGAQLTTPPPCVDVDSDCASRPADICTNPQYTAWVKDHCRKHCNQCNAPNPTAKCVYKGVSYSQGQRWDDGCDLECVCDNANYGYYRCNKRCADIQNLPLGCQLAPVAGQCCPQIKCTGTHGTFTGSQTVQGTIGGYPIPHPQATAAPVPGATPAPGTQTGTVPGQYGGITGSLTGCIYKGKFYAYGIRWDDGCDYTCICQDGNTGQYACNPKCPTFNNLPSECHLQDNPNDPCCRTPMCTTGPSGHLVSVVPSYGKGFTGYGRPVLPNYQTGTGTTGTGTTGTGTPVSGTNAPMTGQRNGCSYKGTTYTQGQTWDDACQYKCQCTDGSTGQYRCTERCAKYVDIPAQCHMVQDPADHCCQTIQCSMQAATTQAPLFAQTNQPASNVYCKYKGYYYRQGESWNDGCGLTCRCEDATNHYYQCNDRCAKYDNVPAQCTFVPDPQDPTCCRVPSCQGVGTGNTMYSFAGTVSGYGRPTGISPATLAKTGYGNACLYQGKVYQQGQTWQDGCKLECECYDASTGHYRCTERCPRIANVPSGCHFAQDPKDTCCQKLACDATTLQCADKLTNCNAYGKYVCTDTYKPWAQDNCAAYCGFCGGSSTSTVTAAPATCADAIPNCDQYGADACNDLQYREWAKVTCRKHCNLCGTGTGTGTGMTGTGTGTGTGMTGTGQHGNCADVLPNCASYTQAACHDPYLDWATKNCPGYCGLCAQTVNTGGTVTSAPGGGFSGSSGGCIYKSKYYGAGEHWQDGCQYNCSCENGQTGFYRCVERCATYQLPPGCTLKKAPGECCGVPDCAGVTGTGSGTGTVTGDNPGCVYKGQLYQQGQQWKDGCQYRCTCVDGINHQYSCSGLCLNWQLPNVCHLDAPAPGKCCKTPNCPPSVTLNYPPGYIAE